MKQVYTAPDVTQVAMRQSVLEEGGIGCVMQNQYSAIARGEVSFVDTWPQLWVLRDEDREAALALLDGHESKSGAALPEWTCSHCGEPSEGQFASCWNCGRDRT